MNDLSRLEELIASHATEGLSGDEVMELRRLLASDSDRPDWNAEDFELAAAALDQAMTRSEESMPRAVRARVSQVVQRRVFESQPSKVTGDFAEHAGTRRSWAATGLPWLAAVAALLVAVVGWWPESTSAPELGPTVQRQRLAELPGTLSRGWTATEDPAATEASGDVIWSASEQRGFMRIRGLATNNPSREQYQLWIFDRSRDERYPVDGGVFDIPEGADEILVAIDAKLPVNETYLFAVTVEPPGGVVVSSRERIVLVAEV